MMVRTTISRGVSRIQPFRSRPNLLVGQRTVNPDGHYVASAGQYPASPRDDYSFDFPKSRISASPTVSKGTLRIFNKRDEQLALEGGVGQRPPSRVPGSSTPLL